ncbi:hypothetical protein POM88_012177 [Heracleum sosnowskyi]|uniref:Uncharacterized protein n=1 Tax=Heracleum sosnowskyi TaxID=360622 RepID=A0AAD8N228_9APIA|nr:hypothetical protein POM88_012177 [Heracleum sosnowskyi]
MSHVAKEDNVSASLSADASHATTDKKKQEKDDGKDGDEEYISDDEIYDSDNYDMDNSEKGNEMTKKHWLGMGNAELFKYFSAYQDQKEMDKFTDGSDKLLEELEERKAELKRQALQGGCKAGGVVQCKASAVLNEGKS